jgi:hypothetical protein
LNAALLKRDYGLKHWDIPKDNLCPGIPGRLDYIHLLKDLLGDKGITAKHEGTGAWSEAEYSAQSVRVQKSPNQQRIQVLDVGSVPPAFTQYWGLKNTVGISSEVT